MDEKQRTFIRTVFIEWILTDLFFGLFYGAIVYFAQILNSFLLWYPFAVKTREGHSTGDEEILRIFIYWLTLGLSMHRAHHMHPERPFPNEIISFECNYYNLMN